MWHTSKLVKDGSFPYFIQIYPRNDKYDPLCCHFLFFQWNVPGQEAKRRCDFWRNLGQLLTWMRRFLADECVPENWPVEESALGFGWASNT